MPAEQALTEARRRSGPSDGRGGGGHLAFRARLEESAAFLAPVLLLGGLALSGGGFSLSSRHVAGLLVWLVVVALLALGAAGRAALGRPFYWSAGLLFGLAIWSAISSLWSGSVELSVTEADRVLMYLGVFLAAFLLAQTSQRRQRFGEGIAIALAGVAILALATRLLPHVFDLSFEKSKGTRLQYPLGYWNADAIVFAMAAAQLLWMSRRSLIPFLRWFAVGALPAVLLALYFTHSRGGILSLILAAGTLIVLSRDRLWYLATLLIAAILTLPAILAIHSYTELSNNYDFPPIVGQGLDAGAILLAGIAVTLLAFWGLRRLEAGGSAAVGRALAISRDRRVLGGIAIVAAVCAIVAGVLYGGTAWDKFAETDVGATSSGIAEASGHGRTQFWDVALEAFGEKPILGHGAGTYQFSWDQLRPIQMSNTQAHSLYLQALSELGIVGGLLALGLVLFLLWVGISAWRAAGGRERELFAILLGVSLAFAVGVAYDWFWQLAMVGSVFFMATGILVAGRCGQLWRARAAARARAGVEPEGENAESRRFGLTVAGLAVAWLTMLALIGPLLVDHEIHQSDNAAYAENFESAIEHANTARSIEPWAATPYLQLGLLAQAKGEYGVAVERFQQAIDREDHNWTLYYLKAKAEHQGGQEEAAQESLAEAKRLNPLETCLTEGFEGCG
ncbi:MAG TPA: O-antigen ligase family protein [Solirubrobacterales bacterium]|nr:O-antigen ligase family protein [Solirubrobacterales bacterium]